MYAERLKSHFRKHDEFIGFCFHLFKDVNPLWDLAKRQVNPDNIALSELEDMRKKIDQHDKKLLAILADKMACVAKIGKYKKKNQLTIFRHRFTRIFSAFISFEFF